MQLCRLHLQLIEIEEQRLFAGVDKAVEFAALESYKEDIGDFPTEEDGLDALTSNPGFAELARFPYLKRSVPLDPWAHPYVYRKKPWESPEIISFGADGAPGGSGLNADISSVPSAN